MSGIDIDDANSAIVYSGGWQALTGTVSAQFDETVHTTTNVGASATIKFSGTRIIVFLTVPAGTGTEAISTNMDGQLGSMARDTHAGMAYYQDRWFDSGTLADGVHTLTVSNAGTQGGTPLMLDKFNIEGAVIAPVVAKPSTTTKPVHSSTVVRGTTTQFATVTQVQTTVVNGSNSASASSGSISATTSASASSAKTSSTGTALLDHTQSSTASPSEHTIISTQYVTGSSPIATTTPTANTSNQNTTSAAGTSKFPMAAVVGIVLGTLLILVLLLVAACFLRRRRRRAREAHVRLAGGDRDDGERDAGAGTHATTMRSVSGGAASARPRRPQTDVTPFRVEPGSASGYLARKGSQTGSETDDYHHSASPADADSPTYDATTVVGASTSASEKSPLSPVFSDPSATAACVSAPFSLDFNFATSHLSHVSAAPFSQYVPPGAPSRQPETDAGPYPYTRRPQYLSDATLGGSTGSDIYASTLYPHPHHALASVDSRDVPPAYQSARNVGGGTVSPAAVGTPDPRASGSRFSAMQQLRQ